VKALRVKSSDVRTETEINIEVSTYLASFHATTTSSSAELSLRSSSTAIFLQLGQCGVPASSFLIHWVDVSDAGCFICFTKIYAYQGTEAVAAREHDGCIVELAAYTTPHRLVEGAKPGHRPVWREVSRVLDRTEQLVDAALHNRLRLDTALGF